VRPVTTRSRAFLVELMSDHLAGPGVVLFQRLDHLKDFPEDGYTQLQADYAPDRVVLFAKATNTQKRKDYALVSLSCTWVFSESEPLF
jgi:hypothetical protein